MSTTGEPAAALPAVTAAAEPSLREHALRRLPADRFAGRFEPGSTRGFVVEAIHEGWLLHYGTPRAFARTIDDDLRLLGGDAMFALGLERLAEEGDLGAVAELADLISLTARAMAEGRPDLCEPLWAASVELLAGAAAGDASTPAGARAAYARLALADHR